jgi:hypothetical protein
MVCSVLPLQAMNVIVMVSGANHLTGSPLRIIDSALQCGEMLPAGQHDMDGSLGSMNYRFSIAMRGDASRWSA